MFICRTNIFQATANYIIVLSAIPEIYVKLMWKKLYALLLKHKLTYATWARLIYSILKSFTYSQFHSRLPQKQLTIYSTN